MSINILITQKLLFIILNQDTETEFSKKNIRFIINCQ